MISRRAISNRQMAARLLARAPAAAGRHRHRGPSADFSSTGTPACVPPHFFSVPFLTKFKKTNFTQARVPLLLTPPLFRRLASPSPYAVGVIPNHRTGRDLLCPTPPRRAGTNAGEISATADLRPGLRSGLEIPVATGVATGPPTPGFLGSVDSRKLKAEIYGSVDYRRLQMATYE